MLPTPGGARGPLRAICATIGLAATLSLLGTTALAQGVVTLETPAPPGSQPSTPPDASPGVPSDPQEAMLAFVECMREHGVDMPDPEFSADGRVFMRGQASSGEGGAGLSRGPGDPTFEEANQACGYLVEGQVRSIDPQQQAEMQARALEFAQCMRDHGVDMPDPQFDANGGVMVQIGGAGARPDADTMQVAQEACGGLMGPVGPAGPGGADDPGADDPGATPPDASGAIP